MFISLKRNTFTKYLVIFLVTLMLTFQSPLTTTASDEIQEQCASPTTVVDNGDDEIKNENDDTFDDPWDTPEDKPDDTDGEIEPCMGWARINVCRRFPWICK